MNDIRLDSASNKPARQPANRFARQRSGEAAGHEPVDDADALHKACNTNSLTTKLV
jgi:hypothetical protein